MARSEFDTEAYEMFLDEETVTAFQGGPVPWLKDTEWTTDGVDPSIFPGGELPMKRIKHEDGVNRHSVALLAFALAHRAKHVNGPPRWLLTFKLSLEDVNKHAWEGSLKMYAYTNTLAVLKKLDTANYPGIRDQFVHPISPKVGDELLDIGYRMLHYSPEA